MQGPARQLSILLLEDSSDDVFFFLRSALKLGAAAIHLPHGEAAKQLLTSTGATSEIDRAALPSIIVTDLKMPRCDGIEFVKWLRSKPELKDIPIIVMSSSPRPGDRDLALAAGANGYLVKPCDPLDDEQLLLSIVNSAASLGSSGLAGKDYEFPDRGHWTSLATRVADAVQENKQDGAKSGDVGPDDARRRAVATITNVLFNEELDGRIHRGPTDG